MAAHEQLNLHQFGESDGTVAISPQTGPRDGWTPPVRGQQTIPEVENHWRASYPYKLRTSSWEVTASHPGLDAPAGTLNWHPTTKEIGNIRVDPKHRGQGLATRMWREAHEAGHALVHSAHRTNAGNDWAHQMGGPGLDSWSFVRDRESGNEPAIEPGRALPTIPPPPEPRRRRIRKQNG